MPRATGSSRKCCATRVSALGSTKNDSQRNVNEAINTGKLRLEDIDDWLKLVEGWGNQHVYLYNISSTLRKRLPRPKIQQSVHDFPSCP